MIHKDAHGRFIPSPDPLRELRESFWQQIDTAQTGCWLWPGVPTANGYGTLRCQNKTPYAHRTAYQLTHGHIPPGCDIHHTCGNRRCVNPAHLEALTRDAHIKKSPAVVTHQQAIKTHCKHGHPFSDENTRTKQGKRDGSLYRQCLECRRASSRMVDERRRRDRAQRRRDGEGWLSGGAE